MKETIERVYSSLDQIEDFESVLYEVVIGNIFDKDKVIETCQYVECVSEREPHIIVPERIISGLLPDIYTVYDPETGRKPIKKYKGYNVYFEDRDDVVVRVEPKLNKIRVLMEK
jgi:hypothetical protein